MENNAVIIIRAAGERTLSLCKKLILDQGVPENRIKIVQEVPFSAAMKKSFQLGIESGFKYTCCIDADVLLRPGSIEYMINEFEKMPENVCEIQGLIYDKLFGRIREAGNHLYRTSFLPKAIQLIPEEGVDIRPERYMLGKMKELGYFWIKLPILTGIHDYEQYYKDIYRKCFVQAHKHLHLKNVFLKHWNKNLANDLDYKVALIGFNDGLKYNDEVYINVNQPIYSELFSKIDISEKNEINIDNFSLKTIEKIICPVLLQQFKDVFYCIKKFKLIRAKKILFNLKHNYLFNYSILKYFIFNCLNKYFKRT